MPRLVFPASFEQRLRTFTRRHPELRARIREVLLALERDPSERSLRTHPLHGQLAGLHAIRLNRTYRLVVRLDWDDDAVVLLDIGGHDEVYR